MFRTTPAFRAVALTALTLAAATAVLTAEASAKGGHVGHIGPSMSTVKFSTPVVRDHRPIVRDHRTPGTVVGTLPPVVKPPIVKPPVIGPVGPIGPVKPPVVKPPVVGPIGPIGPVKPPKPPVIVDPCLGHGCGPHRPHHPHWSVGSGVVLSTTVADECYYEWRRKPTAYGIRNVRVKICPEYY